MEGKWVENICDHFLKIKINKKYILNKFLHFLHKKRRKKHREIEYTNRDLIEIVIWVKNKIKNIKTKHFVTKTWAFY